MIRRTPTVSHLIPIALVYRFVPAPTVLSRRSRMGAAGAGWLLGASPADVGRLSDLIEWYICQEDQLPAVGPAAGDAWAETGRFGRADRRRPRVRAEPPSGHTTLATDTPDTAAPPGGLHRTLTRRLNEAPAAPEPARSSQTQRRPWTRGVALA